MIESPGANVSWEEPLDYHYRPPLQAFSAAQRFKNDWRQRFSKNTSLMGVIGEERIVSICLAI
jgi:hypothetical protein